MLAARFEDALALARRLLTLTREHGERGYEAHALRLLGDIPSHRDLPNVGEAEDYYRQALALGDELGMRPLVAHCYLGLGKLYRPLGKIQQAQEHLAAAVTLFREHGQGFWREKAESEMAALR